MGNKWEKGKILWEKAEDKFLQTHSAFIEMFVEHVVFLTDDASCRKTIRWLEQKAEISV